MIKTRPTLLVVDDEILNIDILIESLGKDYNVRVDTDGAAALKTVNEAAPDLILLDVMMPGMDGFEVCRRLKDDPATCDIPIIFLTGLTGSADEARGLEMGAVDYITKPFHPALVKTRVRNHLELKAHRDHLEALVEERTHELARAYEHLRELDQLKDDFLGMISHELRTPANGVLGIGELIIDLCPASEDRTLYSDLFGASSLRLRNLIEDATMIADMGKEPQQCEAEGSFIELLDDVRTSLQDIHLSVTQHGSDEPVYLRGDPALLRRAMETMIRLATAFSRKKDAVQMTSTIGDQDIRVRIDTDHLLLSEGQAAGFFEIGSSARGISTAQELGLAPVVAHKIISAFGGEMKLIKGDGQTGYLEAVLRGS